MIGFWFWVSSHLAAAFVGLASWPVGGWLVRTLSSWRLRRYAYANSIGELTNNDPLPERVADWLNFHVPVRPLRIDSNGEYIPRHGVQQLRQPTQLLELTDTPTGEFNAVVKANWTPLQVLDLEAESADGLFVPTSQMKGTP